MPVRRLGQKSRNCLRNSGDIQIEKKYGIKIELTRHERQKVIERMVVKI